MTFTYVDTSVTTTLAKVRLHIGDTKEQDYSLTDEEIQVAIDATSAVVPAAIQAMKWRIAKLAEYIANSAAGQSKQLNQKFEQAKEMLKTLQQTLKRGGSNVYAGTIEQDRIDTAKEDTNYPQPRARVGQDDRDRDPLEIDECI